MISDLVRPARTVKALLDAAAEAYGDAPALCMEQDTELQYMSYRTLAEDIRRTAAAFVRRFGQKRIVALPGSMSPEWMPVYLSVLYSGNIAVPIELSKADGETLEKLRRLEPDVLFTGKAATELAEAYRNAFPGLAVLSMEAWQEEAGPEPDPVPDRTDSAEIRPDDTAMLVFTSGTTGNNKIVELTHRNICTDALLSVTYLDSCHGVSARVLSALPTFHMYGITAPIFGSFYRGFTLCIGGGAYTLRRDLQRFCPEILLVVPMIIYNFGKKFLPVNGSGETAGITEAVLSAAKQFFGGALKTVITGGAPLDPGYSAFFAGIGAFLMNGYGITECSPIVSCDVAALHMDGAIGKTGIIPEFCTVKTDDGEICVKGEIVSPGYWKEPELNRLVYKDGWFYTGDLGKIDEDGYLYITGRKKNILILPDGNNISLDELEKMIEQCPGISEAIVLGSVVKDIAVLEAVVYADPQLCKSSAEIQAEAEAWIGEMNRKNPRYKRISGVRITEEPFERTALGKIRKYMYSAGGQQR